MDSENLPILSCCGNSTLHGSNFSSSAFSVSCTLHPFSAQPGVSCDRPPIVCLKCGGYLNSFAKFDDIQKSWSCAFCNYLNPPFSPREFLMEDIVYRHREVKCANVDYEEFQNIDVRTIGIACNFYVFMVHSKLCGDSAFHSVLKRAIENIPTDSRLTLIIFDSVINVVRLLPLKFPVLADIIPGDGVYPDQLSLFVSQGVYCCNAERALSEFPLLVGALKCLSSTANNRTAHQINNRIQNKRPTATVAALINLALTMRQRGVGAADAFTPAIRLQLFTANSLPLGDLSTICPKFTTTVEDPSTAIDSLVSGYSALGQESFRNGCFIDAYVISAGPIQAVHLEALVASTGGQLFVWDHIHEGVALTVENTLQVRPSAFSSKGEALWCSLRCSPGIHVQSFLGVLAKAEEGGNLTPYPDDDDAVDQTHLAHTLQLAQVNNATDSPWSALLSPHPYHVSDLRNKIARQAAKNVYTFRLYRGDPRATVTAMLKSAMTQTSQTHSAKDEDECDYIQLVVRLPADRPGGGRRTKVYTKPLRHSRSPRGFLEELDEEAWAVGQCRAIVERFHWHLSASCTYSGSSGESVYLLVSFGSITAVCSSLVSVFPETNEHTHCTICI